MLRVNFRIFILNLQPQSGQHPMGCFGVCVYEGVCVRVCALMHVFVHRLVGVCVCVEGQIIEVSL